CRTEQFLGRSSSRSPRLQGEDPRRQLVQELPTLDPEVLVGVRVHAVAGPRLLIMRARLLASVVSSFAVCRVCPLLISLSFDAWATFEIATLTCSTAVACCFVESSISLAASLVVFTMSLID